MEFRLLGAFEVSDNGQPVEITGSKRRALLALLVLRANEVVRSELLVDALWGEHPPRNATSALQTHVSRLRKTLGADTIARREWGYVLRAAPGEIDLRRFEGLLAVAEQLAAKERASALAEALALWRGPPLADLVNEPALERDIARLEELRLSTLERRIDAELEAGQNGNLVGELETLIAEQPLREHLRWLLILSLYRAGRQAEALEVYRETRRVLTEELGLEPSPALRELEQAILRQDPSLDATAAPTPTDPIPAVSERKRRRVPPVPILALLALGLAGTATAMAMVRPEKGTSSAAATEAIFPTLEMTGGPANGTGGSAGGTKARTATKAKHHGRAAGSAATNHVSASRGTRTIANGVHKKHKHAHTPPPMLGFGDAFTGPSLSSFWTASSEGTGSSYTQGGGQATFSIAADATFDPQSQNMPFGAGNTIGTRCRFPGPFDARVHFTLWQWPTGNGASIWLGAAGADSEELIARSSGRAPDEGYDSWPPGAGTNPVRPLDDRSGALRMTRSHGIVHLYYWHSRRWKQLTQTALGGNISLQIGIGARQDLWQGQDVSADIDNFKVTAPYINQVNGCGGP